MRCLTILFVSMGIASLMGCSPVKLPVTSEYQLNSFNTRQYVAKPQPVTLLVTTPDAVAGYETEEMLYVKKPFQLEAFAKNAWTNPPADMLYPLLVQSLQRSGYFYAVASSPYSAIADYRLDTQLLALEQNFLRKPSFVEFTVKVVLTRTTDSKVIASRIITQKIPCPADTPYGGVIAANKASDLITATVTKFVISHIKRD